MNCQDCGENEAFIHLTEIVDGEVRSVWLCTRCSRLRRAAGRESFPGAEDASDDSENLVSFLGDKDDAAGADSEAEVRICPSCDYRLEDWRGTSLLGCPRCYQAFRTALAPHLARYHGHASHFGKRPRNRLEDPNQLATIQRVRTALNKAVGREDFEEAAHLRDLLRMLKQSKEEEA